MLEITAVAYVGIGLAVGARALYRQEGFMDAILVALAWPLMLPLGRAERRIDPRTVDPAGKAADEVRAALASVEEAARGTPYATLLDARAGLRLREELLRATQRVRAIDDELERTAGQGPASAATRELRREADTSLRAIRDRDLAAMTELADLLGALRSRIVLARHAGSLAEGPESMVSEVWSRIVGLGEALETTERAPHAEAARSEASRSEAM